MKYTYARLNELLVIFWLISNVAEGKKEKTDVAGAEEAVTAWTRPSKAMRTVVTY